MTNGYDYKLLYFSGMIIERKFKVGDVVVLNSGGPNMTVVKNVEGQVMVECEYYIDGEFKKKNLHEDMISHVAKL